MYKAYVSVEEYEQTGGEIPADEQEAALTLASHHVDALTYNRIIAIGWDNLTEFQKEIIQDTVCRQADFEYENSDMIRSVLSGYSLNGASVQFGSSWNVVTQNGVAMQRDSRLPACAGVILERTIPSSEGFRDCNKKTARHPGGEDQD